MPALNRSNTEVASGASDDVAAITLDAAEGLHRLLEQVAIYPSGHPVVERARDEAVAQIHRSLRMRSPLEIRVGPESVSVDSSRYDSARCRSLGRALFGLDVSSIEVRTGVTPDEILTLVREIARIRASDRAIRTVEVFPPTRFRNVSVTVVDYGALRFAEGARGRALAEDPEALWNTLAHAIIGGSDASAAMSPEELGHLLGEEIARMEDVGSGTLARELRRLTAGIESLAPTARRDAEDRMNRLLASLPSSLRTELLRIELSGSSVLESPFAGRLRSAAVMTSTMALFDAVRCGERPPQDALALVNQLLRVSSITPDDRKSLKEAVIEAATETPADELSRIQETVREIFLNRGGLEANPADYQDLIEFLAVRGAAPAAGVSETWRNHFDDPSDGEATRTQALKIAIDQLRQPVAEISPLGALAYVSAATTALIEGERFEILLDALNAAESCAHALKDDELVRLKVRSYADDILHPSRIAAFLDVLRDKDRVPEAAAELLRRAGANGLESILLAIAAGPPPTIAASLHEVVRSYPSTALLDFAEARITDGWAAVRHLFPVLQSVPDPAVTEFLLRTLDHSEDLLRCEALSALMARKCPTSVLEPAMLGALRDPSHHVVRIALHALQEVPTAESVDVIGRLVEGRLSRSSAASVSIRTQAARGLTKHGKPGWLRLYRSLDRLAWSFRRTDRLVARRLADAIRVHSGSAATGKLLRRWRWSPARLLSLGGGSSS